MLAPNTPKAQAPSILVVDSQRPERDTYYQQLMQLGYDVLAVEEGRKALDLLSTRSFQLMLLAIDLWGTNSYQILEHLQTQGILRSMPVLMLTSSDSAPGIEQCLKLGANDFIALPALPAVMQARISACLLGQRLQQREQDLNRQEELLKIEHDVQIARQIQAGFLPEQMPQIPGWEITASFHPAREVAGDFYDAFMLTQNRRLGFVVADVCDKGVGASLFMALSRSLLRAYAQQHQSLSWMDVLADQPQSAGRRQASPSTRQSPPSIGATALRNAMVLTNDYITNTHTQMNMFVTLFFGVLNPLTGALLYVNGGHPPPMIIGPNGIKATLPTTGPAIGLLPNVDFQIGQAQLEPGDILFCYTDGVTDARSSSKDFFGTKRLQQLLGSSRGTASTLLHTIETNLQAHIGNAAQFDDITMLAIRREEEQSPNEKDS